MTIYANVVNVRSAGKDVVLEFGSFFPDSNHQFPPSATSADASTRSIRDPCLS